MLTAWLCSVVLLAPPPRLVDAGATPRRVLTYAMEAGTERDFTLTTELDTSQTVAGAESSERLAPVDIKGSAYVAAADGNGATIMLLLQSVEVRETKGTSGARALAVAWSQLRGARFEIELTPQGDHRRLALILPGKKPVPPAIGEGIRGLYDAVRSLHARLPLQPVGPGASWVTEDERLDGGARLKRTVTWTLESATKRGFRLAATTRSAAAAQDFEVPDLPPGMTARMDSVTGQGQITLNVRRSEPIPRTAKTESSTRMRVTARTGKKTVVIDTHAATRSDLRSRPEVPYKGRGSKTR